MTEPGWESGETRYVGSVYLLHFGQSYYHARHYLGFTRNVENRIRRHRRGRGSPLVRAVVESGIEIFLARRWERVTRAFERRLHRRESRLACPICRGPQALRVWQPRRDSATGIGV
jgi:predicted GIY-YIG superfamily endonuclease